MNKQKTISFIASSKEDEMNGSSNLDDERFNFFKRLEEGVHVNIERRLE